VYSDADVVLYENQEYLPRAFLVPSAVVERPGLEIVSRMAHGDFSPERFVILEEQFDVSRLAPPARPDEPVPPIRFNRPDGTESSSGPGTVRIVRFDTDHLRLEAEANQNAMLFLADLAYPGWRAYVDGTEAPIYRANYLFRAVYLPAGQHTVDFIYRPRSFRLGLLVTVAATLAMLAALAALAAGGSRRPRWPRRKRDATMGFPGTEPPAAEAATAGWGIERQKGAGSDGRQEPQEHCQEEPAEEGRVVEEEVARPSKP
jgi:hypothetical protein